MKLPKIFKFAAVILVIIIIVEVWMVNRLSTYGDKLQDLVSKKNKIETENKILEGEISKNTSLQKIEELAKRYGFAASLNIEYINE